MRFPEPAQDEGLQESVPTFAACSRRVAPADNYQVKDKASVPYSFFHKQSKVRRIVRIKGWQTVAME
jgi:hypothetical protein